MKEAMKGANHRNKIGRLHKDAVPHFWDAFHGNSSLGSTAKVGFQVGMCRYICAERKKKCNEKHREKRKRKNKKGKINENHRKMF